MTNLYKKTKGLKTIAGFVIMFAGGGLLATGIIDEGTSKIIITFGAMLASFGVGDKTREHFIG